MRHNSESVFFIGSIMNTISRILLVKLICILTATLSISGQELQRGDLNFIIVSDLGAFGGAEQKKVAETLSATANKFPPTAILNTGDTFHFWGVQSIDDPGWKSNFEDIYTDPMLHNLWYAALGNHDYQGNTQALIDYTNRSRRWNMPDRYYTQWFKRGNTKIKLIVIDTTPFLRRARTQPEIYPDAAAQDTAAQMQWLAKELQAPEADWVIVAAHHPLMSNRPDGAHQREDVYSHLAPVLAQCPPDFYINGDVHCFEHFQPEGVKTNYVTCSSGAKAYPVENTTGQALYVNGSEGFCTMAAGNDSVTVTMIDKDGNILYSFTTNKETNKP